MKLFKTLIANKWYTPAGMCSGRTTFPSPQSMLKESYGYLDYSWTSEGPTSSHIRAAVILPANVRFSPLLDNVQWGMSAKFKDKRMIIISELNARRWIDQAIDFGVDAWMINHAKSATWIWTEPPLDEHNNKIRPICLMSPRSNSRSMLIQR